MQDLFGRLTLTTERASDLASRSDGGEHLHAGVLRAGDRSEQEI